MASSLQLRHCPQLKREDHWKLCSQSDEAANTNNTAIFGAQHKHPIAVKASQFGLVQLHGQNCPFGHLNLSFYFLKFH